MVKIVDYNKANAVAQSITHLNKGEIEVLAEIMVDNTIADDLEFYLSAAKLDKNITKALDNDPHFSVA
tara:strand:+ start:41 stop:244 length:204 start_codon:yes stop_codon:yes gene_type:complete